MRWILVAALGLAACEGPPPQVYDDARASKPPYGPMTSEQAWNVWRFLKATEPAPQPWLVPQQNYGTQTICAPMPFNQGSVVCNN